MIEAVFAKLPVVLFEYPVYVTDLKQTGFEVVSLGDTVTGTDARGLVQVDPARVGEAATGVIRYLKDADARRAAVEKNFALAKAHYSLHALRQILEELLSDIGMGGRT